MTDNKQQTQEASQDAKIRFDINAQYIKDLSFENPGSPALLLNSQSTQPEISIKVDVSAKRVGDSIYEVVLGIHARTMKDDKVFFAAELAYAGVFTILNLSVDQLKPLLMIECPRILFPYARQILSDVTRDGGYPPLYLQPIDFVDLYRRQLEAEQAEGGNAEEPTVEAKTAKGRSTKTTKKAS